MFYDPYDEEVQVKFHRTDPNGRINPLEDLDELHADAIENIGAAVALVVLSMVSWCLI